MKNFKELYLSAAHLLMDSYVLFYKEEYPYAHIMSAARRGLKAACRQYDPTKKVPFVRYAEYRIHNSVQRCLAEEAPGSRAFAQHGPSKAALMAHLKSLKEADPEEREKEERKIRINAAKIEQKKKNIRQARLYRKLIRSKQRKRG